MWSVGRGTVYKPALDGVRALAVVAVLFFHGGVGAPGGFLGVSVFFTLSGYLITSLLLAEHARTGTISVRAFYGRRLRRLMPAAFLCFALVLALGGLWTASQRRDLPGELLAALADIANWHSAFATTSYRDLFLGAPSPVAHFWSLAIEEQIYIVLPIVAVVALRKGRVTFAVVTGALLVGSLAATLLTVDRDLVYNGTHTRAGELLLGVALAQLPFRRRAVRRVLRAAAPVALATLIVLALKATITDRWLYDGGLIVVGLLSATLIGGIAHGGPLARVLGNPTLAALGRLSYGIYLFHWPLFLVLDGERTGLDGFPLFALRTGAALAAAVISYALVEQPIRDRRRLVIKPRGAVAAGAGLVVLSVAALVAVPAPGFSATEALLEEADAGVIVLTPRTASVAANDPGDSVGTTRPTSIVAPTPTTTPTPAPETTLPRTGPEPDAGSPATSVTTAVTDVPGTSAPPPSPRRGRLLVVGSHEGPIPALAEGGYDVVDGVQRGCPVATAVEVLMADGSIVATHSCEPSRILWARLLAEAMPDVMVVSTGELDRGTTRRVGESGFPAPGDLLEHARRLDAEESDLHAAIAVAEEAGVDIWVVDHRAGAAKDLFDERLARLALTNRAVKGIAESDDALVDSLDEGFDAAGAVRTLRVLVIGDSVSLNVARALVDAAPSALDVAWAGENGCPIVRARATRIASDGEWTENRCRRFDEKLPPLLDERAPDLVVLVVSLAELADQLYWDDDEAHAPGDAEYIAFHDAEMEALAGILEPRGIPLLVADSPPISPGAIASDLMAEPGRIEAWNAQVRRWADTWPGVDVFEFAAPLLAVEAQSGSIRNDGVHPELEPLTAIAREVYVPAIIAQAGALRAAAG